MSHPIRTHWRLSFLAEYPCVNYLFLSRKSIRLKAMQFAFYDAFIKCGNCLFCNKKSWRCINSIKCLLYYGVYCIEDGNSLFDEICWRVYIITLHLSVLANKMLQSGLIQFYKIKKRHISHNHILLPIRIFKRFTQSFMLK